VAKPPTAAAKEFEELRARALRILEVFDREDPGSTWAGFRDVVQRAKRVDDLRSINRDLRGAMSGLAPDIRSALERELADRFGADLDQSRIRALAAKARLHGVIRSEREFRAVQAYADSIAGERDANDEFLALGALLDEYMSRSELPNGR